MMHARKIRVMMMASAAFLTLAGPAFALDGADMMKKLSAALELNGSSLAFDKADVDGDTVTARGVKVQVATQPGEALAIGEVTFEGVEETDDGGYYAETVSFPNVDVSQDEGSVSIKDIAIGGLSIPGNPSGDTIDSILLYESFGSGPMEVKVKGKEVFSIASVESSLTRQENDAGFDFDATVAGMKADLSNIEDAKTKEAIDKLGLTQLDGQATMKGSWELESGNLALEEYAIDFKDIGRLNIAMDFSGYTLQFLKSLQEAAKAAEANPNKEEADQAMGLAMLGLMQQLTFNSASIRFDDASITRKALDYAGSQQGVSGEQLAESLKAMVPIMMAQLNVPELQKQVTDAVNAYLDSPKSLTIRAEPANPVPFPMIMGAAMGAPNTIPSVLGVKVTAND